VYLARLVRDLALPVKPSDRATRDRFDRRVGRGPSVRQHGRGARGLGSRSGSSTLRRTLAGLLLPTEGYRTERANRVVLFREDEHRLTRWMRANLFIAWAEDPVPEEIEDGLVRQMRPPLNVHGVPPAFLQTSVVAARRAYNTNAHPPDSTADPA
jgi:hypothetical protein